MSADMVRTQVPQLLAGVSGWTAGVTCGPNIRAFLWILSSLSLVHKLVPAAVSLAETTLQSLNLQMCDSLDLRMKTNQQSMQTCEEG